MKKKINRVTVDSAQPFELRQLGSLGNASDMLVRQYRFPFDYDRETEQMTTSWSDRAQQFDANHFADCFRQYETKNSDVFAYWARESEASRVFAFLKKIMKASEDVKWTGFRIMATVMDNGHTIFCWQLFAKSPGSKTLVYSDEDAPNVQKKS
jgi:hypothetical protein